ncbi:uncharacterized protein LOC136072248 [Hydra vulgaris]|uniref:uncharacterized protein LOC136072248 n=1 Tax=Hydra vulgaris TaxID=6087 RepID=UPI0032E9E2A1
MAKLKSERNTKGKKNTKDLDLDSESVNTKNNVVEENNLEINEDGDKGKKKKKVMEKRFFKCITYNIDEKVGNVGTVVTVGRYSGGKPRQAASKAFQKLHKNITNKSKEHPEPVVFGTLGESVVFGMLECTRTRKKKKKYFYTGIKTETKPQNVPVSKIDPKTGEKTGEILYVITYRHNNPIKKLDIKKLSAVDYEKHEKLFNYNPKANSKKKSEDDVEDEDDVENENDVEDEDEDEAENDVLVDTNDNTLTGPVGKTIKTVKVAKTTKTGKTAKAGKSAKIAKTAKTAKAGKSAKIVETAETIDTANIIEPVDTVKTAKTAKTAKTKTTKTKKSEPKPITELVTEPITEPLTEPITEPVEEPIIDSLTETKVVSKTKAKKSVVKKDANIKVKKNEKTGP